MEKPVLERLAVFAGWTFTSFACHFCGSLFLKESKLYIDGFYHGITVLTGMQIVLCLTISSGFKENDVKNLKNSWFIFAAHACATYTTNWSMAVTHAASTFAIKLTEPLSSAILQRLCHGVTLSNTQWLSIPVVVYGAMMFAKDTEKQYLYISYGSVLAFISNICLGIRNINMKSKHSSGTEFFVSYKHFTSTILLACVFGSFVALYLLNIEIVPLQQSVYLSGLLLISSLCHVTYSYISAVIVLKQYTVVGHTFWNIVKRLFVICLLYITGSRIASLWNFIGLFTCALGLLLYSGSNLALLKLKASECIYLLTTKGEKERRIMSLMIRAIAAISSIVFVSWCISYTNHLLSAYNPRKTLDASGLLSSKWCTNRVKNLSLSRPPNFSMKDFCLMNPVKNPEKVNRLSRLLTKRPDVIDEAQRIHMNIFHSLLGRYIYAMLFNYTPSENKGDSAIAVGEMFLLRKLGIKLLFTCTYPCPDNQIRIAHNLSKAYTENELVILFHGGGSIIGYPEVDINHSKLIKRFMRFTIVMFPQSILYIKPQSHIDFCKRIYAFHPRLIFSWRDKTSYKLGKMLFPRVRSLLSPDMAYQIGVVPRFMAPTHDIIWLKRTDNESPVYDTPQPPKDYRMHVSDYWYNWSTNKGASPMEDIFLKTTNGLMFLQRGRIVVTDRLHGHILSTLLGIPHVYIENKQHKISNYHNTWTAGIENIVLANSSLDAVEKAKELLRKLDKDLPTIKGFYPDTSL